MTTRETRTYNTAEVVIAFAGQGVAMETIARALVVSISHIVPICNSAKERGSLAILPPMSPTDTRSASLAELVNLRQQLDDAREEIREILKTQSAVFNRYHAFAGTTRNEATLLGLLAERGRVSKQLLYDTLYSRRNDSEQADPKIIDVFICKLRKKLSPLGITIKTLWGHGWEMSPEMITKLESLAFPSPSIVPEQAPVT